MKKFKVQFTELVRYETIVEAETKEDAEEVVKNGNHGSEVTIETDSESYSIDDVEEMV